MRSKNRPAVQWVTLFLWIVLGSGCSASHLVFSTYTKVGLDITVAEGTPTEAVFGYKRFEGAVVPVDPEDPKGTLQSVYAGVCVRNSWLKGLKIGQVFATGTAATNLADNVDAASPARKWVDDECGGESQ
jgi:hypothetical protein